MSLKSITTLLITIIAFSVFAEKVLIYDEEKGITFIDSDKQKSSSSKKKNTTTTKRRSPKATVKKSKAKEDLHINRKKDPPELYFKSGLKYYQNENYKDALKNFRFASEKSLKPQYLLWIGKTYRKLGKKDQMLTVMNRIVDDFSESPVADDALFEIAFYYQKNNYYSKATEHYKLLAERYPFGLSYSNGEEFLEVSRRERQRMRGEILSALPIIGIKADNLKSGYLKFQHLNKLKETGEGDSATISLIKEHFAEISQKEEATTSLYKSLTDNLKWAIIAAIINTIILISMIFIMIKLKHSSREISLMTETLSDMRFNKNDTF